MNKLDALLRALEPQDPSTEPRQIAELLWLAGLSTPTQLPSGYTRRQSGPSTGDVPQPVTEAVIDRDQPSAAATGSKSERLFLPDGTARGESVNLFHKATKVRVSGPEMLVRRSELTRALRPLKRRVPSPIRRVLDEDATASHNAERRHWMPVFKPAEDRWLDVALVVDALSECAVFWEPLARELQAVLRQLGAFRDVRLRYLRDRDDGTVGLSPTPIAAPHLLRSPVTAPDPTRRTMILLLTDGVAPAWRTERLRDMLRRWSISGPTAILQPLPEHAWEKTSLAPTQVRMHSLEAGSSNPRLLFQEYGFLPRAQKPGDVPIPVLEATPEWIEPWAHAVASSSTFDGLAVVLRGTPSKHESNEYALYAGDPRSPRERMPSVDEFRASVQPGVFRLAAYLAAAPLNLSVMRTVQSAMLPASPLSDLAEIIFSGLLQRQPAGPHTDALSQDYEFIAGARERLLGSLRSREADDVIAAVSAYVKRHAPATSARFTAAALDPDGPIVLSAGARHWAEVHNLVRRRQRRPTIKLAELQAPVQPATDEPAAVHQNEARERINPPPAVVASGKAAVEAYLRDSAAGSAKVWRSRLLIVGEAAVGKTSLAKDLVGRTFDPQEPQTHGIHIDSLRLAHPTESATEMDLSVWDFGGQLEYRATHRFCLTDPALVLLTWNARTRWRDGKLLEWLDTITAVAPASPIMLVATHSDEGTPSLPDDLRKRYPTIVGVFETDAQSGSGIHELREAIRRQSADLPLMGASWPRSWIDAAAQVRRLATYAAPTADVWRAMAAAGVDDPTSQQALAGCLSGLGDVVYIADDQELDDVMILNPQWLDAHITMVLDSQAVAESSGLLTHAECTRLWSDVSPDLRDRLIRIMERFGLAYRIHGGEDDENLAFIVERLGYSRPTDVDPLWERALIGSGVREAGIDFRLKSRQAGIPSWFIAREHRYTTGLQWARGVLLHDPNPDRSAYALVSYDGQQQPTFSIRVRGQHPTPLLSLLIEGFTRIVEERYPGLIHSTYVPCLCQQPSTPLCGHTFKLEELLAEVTGPDPDADGKVRCPVTRRRVEVKTMLEGLRGHAVDEQLDQVEVAITAGRNDGQHRPASQLAAEGKTSAPNIADLANTQIVDDGLGLRSMESLEDLGDALRRLRRRHARRRSDALLSYRYLAEKTGYAHGVIGGYFSGKVLPPPDKLDVLVVLLGADSGERLAFAAARDAIETRRRTGAVEPQQPAMHAASEVRRPTPETTTSTYLYDLLTRPGAYRTLWRSKLTPGDGALTAITEVLAEYLASQQPDEIPQNPQRLRRRVSRALAGQSPDAAISSMVLEWFIGAFKIDPRDADRLRFLHSGSSSVRYVRGDVDEAKLPLVDAPEATWRTLDLREYHDLGPDGLPATHRTEQIVEALADGVDHISYILDDNTLTVDVQSGGAVPGPSYQMRSRDGKTYRALDLRLDRTLRRGETAILNYTTTFSYSEQPAAEVRRAFRRKVDRFLLWVRFHPDMMPTAVWWAEWDGIIDGQIMRREKMTLNQALEAHRFLEGGVEHAVVGFYWEW